jgi:membrane-associated phospholipid phosphatase
MSQEPASCSELIEPLPISKQQVLCCGTVFAVLWSIAGGLWAQGGLDASILFALNNAHFNDTFVTVIQLISRYGMAAIAGISLCYLVRAVIFNNPDDDKRLFLLIIFSFGIAGVGGDLLKLLFDRARPIVDHAGELSFLTSSGSPSFPSGHATKSAALALPFLFYAGYRGNFHQCIRILMVFIVLSVGFARIVLAAHYLSDVLAGIGLAFLCLPGAVVIGNKLLSKMASNKKLDTAAKRWILVYIGLIILLCII